MSTNSEAITDGKELDFYKLLNVEKTASESEIKSHYRKLALKFHPDRNRNKPDAEEQFKQLATAYAVLSDPNKRRQYDLSLSSGNGNDMFKDVTPLDVNEMGGFGRMMGALFSKIGIPIPTQICQPVLNTARDIQTGVKIQEKYFLKRLPLGIELTGKVDKQEGHFYQIELTEQDITNGIVITCRSAAKSKFKLILFDSKGGVRMVQESSKRVKCTAADMYCTKLEFMDLNENWHFDPEKTLPDIFTKLSTFEIMTTQSVEVGTHLLCVYGDNWFSALKYTIQCMKLVVDRNENLKEIQSKELELLQLKQSLDQLQGEYVEVKKKYEDMMELIENKEQGCNDLLQTREASYENYLADCSNQYSQQREAYYAAANEANNAGVNGEGNLTFRSLWKRFGGNSNEAGSTTTTTQHTPNIVNQRNEL